jgi:hypothetical protein
VFVKLLTSPQQRAPLPSSSAFARVFLHRAAREHRQRGDPAGENAREHIEPTRREAHESLVQSVARLEVAPPPGLPFPLRPHLRQRLRHILVFVASLDAAAPRGEARALPRSRRRKGLRHEAPHAQPVQQQ